MSAYMVVVALMSEEKVPRGWQQHIVDEVKKGKEHKNRVAWRDNLYRLGAGRRGMIRLDRLNR